MSGMNRGKEEFFICFKNSVSCLLLLSHWSIRLCLPKPEAYSFKNLQSDFGPKLKELEKLELLIHDSIWKCYCQPQRAQSFSCCPHVSSWDLSQWVGANAFDFAELRATKSLLFCLLSLLDPFSPSPKWRPNSSSKFWRLDAQLCILALHYQPKKIIKDRKKHNTLDWMIMQYWCSAQG